MVGVPASKTPSLRNPSVAWLVYTAVLAPLRQGGIENFQTVWYRRVHTTQSPEWPYQTVPAPTIDKLLLFVMSSRCNSRGELFASQRKLGKECGLSRATMSRTYRTLISKQLIQVIPFRKENGHNGTPTIRLLFENIGRYLEVKTAHQIEAEVVSG